MKLKIDGMTCEHCVAAVREALTDVDGVVQVTDVSLADGTAEIEGNPDSDVLLAAVEAEGYTASVAQ
ncbi:cation transporter [Salinisphaera japonica]|uniref:Heavy metal binding protein n=1 Tax=Salinisphaera japonica YTM-1 TaxID=1209778 RepID=A0A423PNK3_9GAMM|nr:cation transporter [Salinisphaera japonica]ROO27195.1 heavy metal binding protein [Salinisphaera japonica YTM-1]